MKIPLNDDFSEKAARLQSRQALHDIQMNQIKAAASPVRKLSNYNRASSSSPKTPRSISGTYHRGGVAPGKENDPDGLTGGVVTPIKRVPILANFEEWMKMATDNKINANNSWNFALIDYFHDMSLLKEGDGVNFQKASCTLDGCVKIYTSRVDSVATETGKLLSGLADSGNSGKKQRAGDGEGDEDEEEEEEGEDGVKKKVKKKSQRSHEATLAPSFEALQLKKLELEFAVDPLFKKASADFDEGGAKGLLLNHLAIDTEGRIVFDSSDDAGDAAAEEISRIEGEHDETEGEASENASGNDKAEPSENQEQEIDIGALASKFFPDLSLLDTQDVCPSLKTFALGDGAGGLDIPFLKSQDDWKQDKSSANGIGDKSGIVIDEENAAGFDDDDDGILGGFDLPPDTGFGEGGEVWAKDAALEPMLRVHRVDDEDEADGENQDGVAVGDFDPSNPSDPYAVSINHHLGRQDKNEHENILHYFDNALRSHKTWAGPEHWRIRRIKDANSSSAATTQPVRVRKEKEPFEIDFLAPLDQSLADMLYTPAASNSAISLPKSQWKTKGKNLLPDDKHFSSKSLLTLFLKPKARLGARRNVKGYPVRSGGASIEQQQHGDIDPAFWASQKGPDEGQGPASGDYDANFFNDDDGLPFSGGIPDDDDDDGILPFADAREMFSPPPSQQPFGTMDPNADPSLGQQLGDPSQSQNPDSLQQQSQHQPGSFGAQLITQGGRRLRPEYVNYARVAKKVDVRKLKENLWEGMADSLVKSMEDSLSADAQLDHRLPTPAPSAQGDQDGDVDMMDIDEEVPAAKKAEVLPAGSEHAQPLKFTSMIQNLRNVYPDQQMRDISTSYCFICLLHLANEKGLVLEGQVADDNENGVGVNDIQSLAAGAMVGPLGTEGSATTGNLLQEIFVRKDMSVGKDYEGE
ncbi:putative condensin complex component cnd2 [Phaeomoniella chlamydospora]|uniref:Condensin complex subunit 2 n=1 Tax=Phaeomoniella chlamydospora TaxID=158046 RepID=A0A0G2E4Z8_PHACM|nr:putative condensin complex component cnd2 [Phaeomoniella chlamydospora]